MMIIESGKRADSSRTERGDSVRGLDGAVSLSGGFFGGAEYEYEISNMKYRIWKPRKGEYIIIVLKFAFH